MMRWETLRWLDYLKHPCALVFIEESSSWLLLPPSYLFAFIFYRILFLGFCTMWIINPNIFIFYSPTATLSFIHSKKKKRNQCFCFLESSFTSTSCWRWLFQRSNKLIVNLCSCLLLTKFGNEAIIDSFIHKFVHMYIYSNKETV